MNTPISYYGGKQNLIKELLPLFPEHKLYIEPFVGGGAVFWAKRTSQAECINDTNKHLIDFYECVKSDFIALEKMVQISLHSRTKHNDASVIYNNGHMFSKVERAWSVWMLAAQGFASMLDASYGYDRIGTTSKKVAGKRAQFTEQLAVRMQNVDVECTDALRIIRSRDCEHAFFYCDPPYFNSDCGHYDGYSKEDFEMLLKTLSRVEGKFILSSYPSDLLTEYTKEHKWANKQFEQTVSVANGTSHGKPLKKKIEVVTANYDLDNPRAIKKLFDI